MIRTRAALLVGIALVLAGCTKGDEPVTEQSIAPGFLTGTVTDVALLPLEGAIVEVEGTNLSATTDATGAFAFELLPGEYVLLAGKADFKPGALRASILSAQTSTLAFQLEGIPKIVPSIQVQEAEGYLACAALVVNSGERSTLPCGEEDPNEAPTVEFGLSSLEGLEGIILEIVWEARTDAASTLRLEVAARDGDKLVPLGATEGRSPLSMTISGRLVSGQAIVASVAPAGGFTDDEATTDAGVAFQQPFTGYASLFYYQEPQGGYSALASG